MPYYYTHSAFRDRTKYLSLSFVTDYLRSRVAHAHYAGRMASVSYELWVVGCELMGYGWGLRANISCHPEQKRGNVFAARRG